MVPRLDLAHRPGVEHPWTNRYILSYFFCVLPEKLSPAWACIVSALYANKVAQGVTFGVVFALWINMSLQLPGPSVYHLSTGTKGKKLLKWRLSNLSIL